MHIVECEILNSKIKIQNIRQYAIVINNLYYYSSRAELVIIMQLFENVLDFFNNTINVQKYC